MLKILDSILTLRLIMLNTPSAVNSFEGTSKIYLAKDNDFPRVPHYVDQKLISILRSIDFNNL